MENIVNIFKKLKEPRSESSIAEMQIEWLLFYGLELEEVPARLTDLLNEKDRKKIFGKVE